MLKNIYNCFFFRQFYTKFELKNDTPNKIREVLDVIQVKNLIHNNQFTVQRQMTKLLIQAKLLGGEQL